MPSTPNKLLALLVNGYKCLNFVAFWSLLCWDFIFQHCWYYY